MSFVKASVTYDSCESITYDDQTSQKLNHKGKAGIGYQGPENSKPIWLKNKLDKDKAKAGSKSFVPNQPRRNSTKTLTDSSTGKTVKLIQVRVPKGEWLVVVRSGGLRVKPMARCRAPRSVRSPTSGAQKRAGSDRRCQEVARTMSGSWQASRGEGAHE
ncbi:hypothetical protein F511_20743 [Dorcoceras hygrometricum]|uniref:Uncharacterized protein n=1 Tax=Dorcoceras hygrometricum TaxID=472368 RepID=A0A2Z7BJP3_9LAMI|nr:hypothetical protein F511_20743 [Dorcoceras hygrometricum]